MTLAHACKAERAEALPWLDRARAALRSAKPADKVAQAYDALNPRERAFWLRAIGAADMVAKGYHEKGHDALKDDVWERMRETLIKSASRLQTIAGGV